MCENCDQEAAHVHGQPIRPSLQRLDRICMTFKGFPLSDSFQKFGGADSTRVWVPYVFICWHDRGSFSYTDSLNSIRYLFPSEKEADSCGLSIARTWWDTNA